MSLAPGNKLGFFEIVAPLGAGVMGEVYRARDTRLDRIVAIKLLPPQFAESSIRLTRFEQEARAASAMNHPNIITIYELGKTDPHHYIAMELVEGISLRQLLNDGAIPMRKTIEIVAQIALGLSKAHEAGIAHRDLKPENIMISRDGLVKILEFGSGPKPGDRRRNPGSRGYVYLAHSSGSGFRNGWLYVPGASFGKGIGFFSFRSVLLRIGAL